MTARRRYPWLILLTAAPLLAGVYLLVNYVLADYIYPGGLAVSLPAASPFPPDYPPAPREKWITLDAESWDEDYEVERRLRKSAAIASEIAGPDWDVQPFSIRQPHHTT